MAQAAARDRLKTYAGFIKLEHTVFSLPLIFAGTLLHARGGFSPALGALILLAAASGRVAAMGLNRLIDAPIDARNPRTSRRELPRGAMQAREARRIVLAALAVYLASAWAIAPVCLWLAPVPVLLFAAYPYLKRFTSLAHVGLGLTWSMAPLAGWLAASKSLAHFGEVAWLWFFSLLWVAGFDIIYATMDEAFDRAEGLHSLPAHVGGAAALRVAAVFHAGALLSLYFLWRQQFGDGRSLAWLLAIAGLFLWQHAVAKDDPEFAFFKLNGILGFAVLGFVLAGV
jgi:4-hydroxybenzoate polyprenyltransferase